MNSLRRAALRAATSAVAVIPKPQTASFVARTAVNASAKISSIQTVRMFNTSAMRFDEGEFTPADTQEKAPGARNEAGELEFQPEPNGVFGVFVWNIPYRSTEREMFDTFSRFGKVHSLNIGRDARGLSRGFSFIYYNTIEEARAACEQANGAFWQGRRIGAKPKSAAGEGNQGGAVGSKRPKSSPTASLYVGNIPYEATDSELNQIFSGLDNVLDVRVAIDKATGWPRGFAHADFTDTESATKAMERLGDVTIQGRSLRIDYSESKSNNQAFNKGIEGPGPNDKSLD